MTDAVQTVTGCSLGHRSLKYVDYGRFAATFINLDTGRAVRATVNEHFSNEPTIEATLDKLARILDSELITMQEVTVSIPEMDLPGPPKNRAVHSTSTEGQEHHRTGYLYGDAETLEDKRRENRPEEYPVSEFILAGGF